MIIGYKNGKTTNKNNCYLNICKNANSMYFYHIANYNYLHKNITIKQ